MKIPKAEKRPRPYWHVDVKWIVGILLFFALGAALLLFNLSKVTEREFVVETSATVVAGLFSRDGLDSDEGLDDLRKKAEAMPGDTITPIEQFKWLTISKQDIQTLSPRELRVKLFSQITGPIYDKGLEAAAMDFTTSKKDQESFVRDASLLGVVTKDTHETVKRLTWIVGAVALVLMVVMILFSAGWGRLVGPAVVMLLVSVPGALVGLLVKSRPPEGGSPLQSLPLGAAESLGNSLGQSYGTAAVVGFSLLFIALVGKIVQRIFKKRRED
jgi:hypothetical protein